MRISRFLLNSDYATLKSDSEGEISLVVPNSVVVLAGQQPTIYRAELDIGAKPSAAYRHSVTSSAYTFSIPAAVFYLPSQTLEGGNLGIAGVPVQLYRQNNKFVAEARFAPPTTSAQNITYSGMGQTLTFHIQSFLDPFSSEM